MRRGASGRRRAFSGLPRGCLLAVGSFCLRRLDGGGGGGCGAVGCQDAQQQQQQSGSLMGRRELSAEPAEGGCRDKTRPETPSSGRERSDPPRTLCLGMRSLLQLQTVKAMFSEAAIRRARREDQATGADWFLCLLAFLSGSQPVLPSPMNPYQWEPF